VFQLELDGRRCSGVRYRRHGREVSVVAGVEAILAAGAIQSPQLLELLGVGQQAADLLLEDVERR